MLKKLLCVVSFVFVAGLCSAADWPDTVSSATTLYTAVNNCATNLSSDISNTTGTITVDDTTCFPSVGYITIENEAAKCTGKGANTFTGCTRGADGTTAASHVAGDTVFHAVIAAHHNVLKDEVVAISEWFLQDSNEIHIDTTNARVGVSTGSPQVGLDVNTSVILGGSGSDTFQIKHTTAAVDSSYGLNFTTDTAGAGDSILFIDGANQRIGVGTNSPSSLLDVNGSISFVDLAVSGGVAIGTTTDVSDGKLHVHSGTAGSVSADGDGDELVLENAGLVGMSFLSANTASANIMFGDVDDNNVGAIIYDHSTPDLVFRVETVDSLTINDSDQLLARDGAVGTPIFSFLNDTDSGIYSSGANEVSFATNGTQRIAVTSDGALSIKEILIAPSASAGYAKFYSTATAGTSEMWVIDGAGNNTQLSAHGFELYDPDPTLPFPVQSRYWNEFTGEYVEIDLIKLADLVQTLTGEQLIYTKSMNKKNWKKSKYGDKIPKYLKDRGVVVEDDLVEK